MPFEKAARQVLRQVVGDIAMFSQHILCRPLRPYQVEPARALVGAVLSRTGEHLVWRWPRQTGKDETIAHVIAYLLFRFQRTPRASIVYTAPTFEPQCLTAIQRVIELTTSNLFFDLRRSDYQLVIGEARAVFLSGGERTPPNVGPTASLLLIKNEAQDLDPDYVARTFDPMTSSTNAPHLLTGTARHDRTLLAVERKAAQAREQRDGQQRVWVYSWQDIARHNPAYGDHVRSMIERYGPLHPTIQTEYENIETSETGKLFDARRVALIFSGDHRRAQPASLVTIATIDVGGATLSGSSEHDFTVAAIHRIEHAGNQPHYITCDYRVFRGDNVLDDTPARAELFRFLDAYHVAHVVVDATGIGVGLASALIAHFSESLVTPFVFTARSKTDLLNKWLALIETGRYRHYSQPPDEDHARLTAQLEQCTHKLHGPHTLWGVPSDATWFNAHNQRREVLHDDHLFSCALVAAVPESLTAYYPAVVIPEPESHRRHGKY